MGARAHAALSFRSLGTSSDELRGGRPTTHKAFNEATAILAGDGLLTLAFDILTRKETHPNRRVRVGLVAGLAHAAGLGGMVGGQMLDLAAEGRFDTALPNLSEAEVRTLQAMKTGALLRFGSISGAILEQADQARREALERYGSALGQAFPIADDFLDVEGDPTLVGKAIGKDAAAHKATFVAVLGATAARRRLNDLVAEAESALAPSAATAICSRPPPVSSPTARHEVLKVLRRAPDNKLWPAPG